MKHFYQEYTPYNSTRRSSEVLQPRRLLPPRHDPTPGTTCLRHLNHGQHSTRELRWQNDLGRQRWTAPYVRAPVAERPRTAAMEELRLRPFLGKRTPAPRGGTTSKRGRHHGRRRWEEGIALARSRLFGCAFPFKFLARSAAVHVR
jgi:hypothetical protein